VRWVHEIKCTLHRPTFRLYTLRKYTVRLTFHLDILS
jgi:hypothetical protein